MSDERPTLSAWLWIACGLVLLIMVVSAFAGVTSEVRQLAWWSIGGYLAGGLALWLDRSSP